MPLNIPGILVHFQLLINPRLVVPGITVRDIRQLDFPALRRAGYRGAVFDKDNCLTLPQHDRLVPDLEEAWRECRETFGEGNVVIVSNMAGTSHDAGQLQAESVTHHLGVPVLRHKSPKPSYSCIAIIRAYFGSLRVPLQDHELIIVGDRILTDVVMANRMHRKSRVVGAPGNSDEKTASRNGPLAIWTTGIWKRENMLIRWWENRLVGMANHWAQPPTDFHQMEATRFIKDDLEGKSITTDPGTGTSARRFLRPWL